MFIGFAYWHHVRFVYRCSSLACRCGYAQPSEDEIRSVMLPLCDNEERDTVHSHYLPVEGCTVENRGKLDIRFQLLRPLSILRPAEQEAHVQLLCSPHRLSVLPGSTETSFATMSWLREYVPAGVVLRCYLAAWPSVCRGFCGFRHYHHRSPSLEFRLVEKATDDAKHFWLITPDGPAVFSLWLPQACTLREDKFRWGVHAHPENLPVYWRRPLHLELPMALYRMDPDAFQSLSLFDRRTGETVCSML